MHGVPSQLLQEELTREECDGDGSELTRAANMDNNSCSSGATNYTDSGAECDKVTRHWRSAQSPLTGQVASVSAARLLYWTLLGICMFGTSALFTYFLFICLLSGR